jgi:hypothetical protein
MKPIADMEKELREAEAWRDDCYTVLAESIRQCELKRAALMIARVKLTPDQVAA